MNVLFRPRAVAAPSITSLCRAMRMATLARVVPAPTTTISTPASFLQAIGRESNTKYKTDDAEMSWDDFWQTDGVKLKAAGVAVRDRRCALLPFPSLKQLNTHRRYILWCMEKYRQGSPVTAFAHPPPPKKTIRGWGPSVQNGKRIRSRRDRNNPRAPRHKKTDAEKEAKKARKDAFRLARDGVLPVPQPKRVKAQTQM
ncbi:IGR domain-containing protein [Mycena chlorophos]|uniref:Small ribosomal subunit protein mS41 n=1 Tax=Mycena chlorophos TaxID=658473 RepID=A0A8H6W556_MYCCL|nr:IGR domain-containing protein [Mycena chlorophos]